jgi:hypothetical protein
MKECKRFAQHYHITFFLLHSISEAKDEDAKSQKR